MSAPAQAASEDVLKPYLSYSYSYDDNMLRLNNRAQAQAVTGTDDLADSTQRLDAGLAVEKQIGQQRFSVNGAVNRTRFSNLRALDYDGRDLRASWNWRVGKYLEGNLGISDTKTLAPFVDFHRAEPNLRRQQRKYFDAAWRMHPSWKLYGGISSYRLTYDLAAQQTADRNEDGTELGVSYVAASDSSVGVLLRHLRGEYPNKEVIGDLVINNDYAQNEVLAKVDWHVTGKTRLQFQGGRVERNHVFSPLHDFRGINGRLTATWLATAKTNVMLSAWRETGSYYDLSSTYTVNQGLSLGVQWKVSAKVQIDGLVKHEVRNFDGFSQLADPLSMNRKDTFRYASLSLAYLPTPRWQWRISIYRDQQSSNRNFIGYRANGAMISTSYAF